MFKKITFYLPLTAILGLIALACFHILTMPITDLILCSAGEGGIRIPKTMCHTAMNYARVNQDDLAELAQGAGLDFILNTNSPKKYQIAELFLNQGLSIDGVNHFGEKPATPLQAAVLYNDIERAKFLLAHGANKELSTQNVPAPLAFAYELQIKIPQRDYQPMIELLSD